MSGMNELLKGHRNFRRKALTREREFLVKLASEGQSPDALYIGCSDSRVVPELLTGSSPGELFVVRNIANIIPTFEHADASVGAALEYAVGHLRVPHVIVCGHYGCGGIKGVIDADPHLKNNYPSLAEWLAVAGPAVERARDPDPERWWRQAVEENVIQQIAHLSSYPAVAEAVEDGRITMHGWVYDLRTLHLSVYDVVGDTFRPAEDVLER